MRGSAIAQPAKTTDLQQLARVGSTSDVDAQTHAQETLELLAQRLWLLQRRSTIGRDQVQRLERFFVQIRRLVLDHLDRHDTERPDVDFGTVFFLLDDLGRHPVGRTHHGRTLRLLIGEFGAETEIGWEAIRDASRPSEVRYVLILTRPSASKRTLSDLISR